MSDLAAILQQLVSQQQAFANSQKQIADQQIQITQLLANQGIGTPAGPGSSSSSVLQLPDIISYEHDDQTRDSFEEWIDRFEYSLDCAAPNMADDAKVKLLMTKLSTNSFSEYKRSCFPDEIIKFKFDETKNKLLKLFTKAQSIFLDRYECLKSTREEGEDFFRAK